MAFTKADGTTELYAEKELFDVSEEKGVFHVSRDGWTIDANTSIFMYYDKDHADNTTYIGAINTAAGAAVWDGNFEAVHHMVDDAGGELDDSTSNNNDGTKTAANNPLEIDAKIAKGQRFAGDDDISIGTPAVGGSGEFTFSAIVRINTDNDAGTIIGHRTDVSLLWRWLVIFAADKKIGGYQRNNNMGESISTSDLLDNDFHFVCFTYDGTDQKIYFDGSEEDSDAYSSPPIALALKIGNIAGDGGSFFTGDIDEEQVSSSARSAAWLKGTYNSLYDTLLTYGSEETEVNAIWFGCNF